MSGQPYEPVVQLSTPITRLAVMEGRTLAIAAYNSKLDDDFEIATDDPAERAAIEEGMTQTAARIEGDMDPVAAASRMDTDEVVPLGRLRPWLECLAESAWQSIGYRRTKNPRIWSLHDLEVLTGHQGPTSAARAARRKGDAYLAPTAESGYPPSASERRWQRGCCSERSVEWADLVPVTAGPGGGSAVEIRTAGARRR